MTADRPSENSTALSLQTALLCPATGERLSFDGQYWIAPNGTQYPLIDSIPWLFPDPKTTLASWRERAQLLIATLQVEIETLKSEIESKNASTLTQERLRSLRLLKIHNLEFIKRVLEPLKINSKIPKPKAEGFGYQIPLRQGLLGYFPNLIRDWSPSYETENQISLKLAVAEIRNSVDSNKIETQKILVLGSGGSRLAYDLAKEWPTSTVVAYDINPILLLAAKAINSGVTLKAVDFPTAPKDPKEPGQKVDLKAPRGTAPNLHFVFGDVYALPFSDEAFDCVVTPWLIDILPRHVDTLMRVINHSLKPGGAWFNFGSLNFGFNQQSENWSVEELEERGRLLGFLPRARGQIEIPYLQSNHNCMRRFETVTHFTWAKVETTSQSRNSNAFPLVDDRADFIRNSNLPIPALPEFANASTTHAVMALVLSLVDGKRTLRDVAKIVATENGLTEVDALSAVQSFFDRFIKDRRFREF